MEKNRKYIFYPIGLISLVLLPITCFWYLDEQKLFNKERCLSIVVANEYMERLIFEQHGFKIHPKRNFISINLTGNDENDKIRLDFAELEIRKFVKIHDTINGIRFHFEDTANYWTLIRAIDICDEEGAKIFNLNGSDMWVYNMPKPKQTDIILDGLAGCLLCGDVVQVKPKTNIILEISNNMHRFLKDNLKISILFVIFSATTIFLFIKSR